MALTAEDLLDRAQGTSFPTAVEQGLSAAWLAFSLIFVSGFVSLKNLISKPVNALATSAAQLTIALVTSPIPILHASVYATAQSLLGPFNAGPLTFALGVGSVLAGLFVVNWYRSREITPNVAVAQGIDLPLDLLPFAEGQEEEED